MGQKKESPAGHERGETYLPMNCKISKQSASKLEESGDWKKEREFSSMEVEAWNEACRRVDELRDENKEVVLVRGHGQTEQSQGQLYLYVRDKQNPEG